jgi:hypothetical protein
MVAQALYSAWDREKQHSFGAMVFQALGAPTKTCKTVFSSLGKIDASGLK